MVPLKLLVKWQRMLKDYLLISFLLQFVQHLGRECFFLDSDTQKTKKLHQAVIVNLCNCVTVIGYYKSQKSQKLKRISARAINKLWSDTTRICFSPTVAKTSLISVSAMLRSEGRDGSGCRNTSDYIRIINLGALFVRPRDEWMH